MSWLPVQLRIHQMLMIWHQKQRLVQQLQKIVRRRGKNVVQDLGGCRFVPLIGKGAWEE